MAEMIYFQCWMLFLSVFYGIVIGIFYDLFRAMRCVFSCSGWMIHIQDFFFVVFSVSGLFLLFQLCNEGQVRWYMIAGTGLGFFLYQWSFQRRVVVVFSWIYRGIAFLWSISIGKIWYTGKIIVKSLRDVLKKEYRTIKIVKSKK